MRQQKEEEKHVSMPPKCQPAVVYSQHTHSDTHARINQGWSQDLKRGLDLKWTMMKSQPEVKTK